MAENKRILNNMVEIGVKQGEFNPYRLKTEKKNRPKVSLRADERFNELKRVTRENEHMLYRLA